MQQRLGYNLDEEYHNGEYEMMILELNLGVDLAAVGADLPHAFTGEHLDLAHGDHGLREGVIEGGAVVPVDLAESARVGEQGLIRNEQAFFLDDVGEVLRVESGACDLVEV